jgi:hypothetical protein
MAVIEITYLKVYHIFMTISRYFSEQKKAGNAIYTRMKTLLIILLPARIISPADDH